MAIRELREMSDDELGAEVVGMREALSRLEMQRHARRLDKSSDLAAAKHELARALTVISERRLAAKSN